MQKHSSLIANLLILLSLGGVGWALWRLYRATNLVFDPWLLPFAVGGVIAVGLLFALAFRFAAKTNIAVIAFSTVLAAYAGNYLLELTGRNVLHIFDAKVVREQAPVAAALPRPPAARDTFVSPRPPATRNPNALFKALVDSGIDTGFMYSAPQLLPLVADSSIPPFLPLSSRANIATLMCNEGDQREFPIIRTDRYGFNNDDTIHAKSGKKILIVGDSFAQGSCVHQEQSVAGVLRRNGYPAISIGIGGFGPLLTLGALQEYGAEFKPETVLWFYFDGNDIVDLSEKGLRSKFVLQYLKDGFSQDLIHRQDAVDAFWRSSLFSAEIGKYNSDKARQEAWEKQLSENLPLVRQLTGLPDLPSLTDDDSLIQVFSRVLATAKRRIEGWGGKLVFVVIPNKDDYHGRVAKYRFPVMSAVEKLGIPIIDVDTAIRAAGDPLDFFPLRDDWGHFNPAGYQVMAEQIISMLESGAEPPRPVAAPPKPEPVAPAPAPATVAEQPPAPAQPTGNIQATYASYGQTSAIIPFDETLARISDGASILGYGFVPENSTGTVKIAVHANAYSKEDNGLVVGIFQVGRDEPLKLAQIPLRAGERGYLDTSVELPFFSRDAMTFDIRVGPARPGTIFINGDATGSKDVPDLPSLSITEGPPRKSERGPAAPAETKKAALPPPLKLGGFWRQQFNGPVNTDSVMATQLSSLQPDQGEEILGFDMQPASLSGKLRVRVSVNALSQTGNQLVFGLFRGDGDTPAGVATALMPPGVLAYLIRSFDLENVRPDERLRVRVGPGRPGTISINGNGKGGYQGIAFFPTMTVAEPNAITSVTTFPDDDGSYQFAWNLNLVHPHSDPTAEGRRKVSCDDAFAGPDTGVFVAFGQSQAANSGQQKYESRRDVVNFNFLDSDCYAATDPLLGGSLWSRLGDRLIDAGAYNRVVFAPIAVGGTFLSEWMPGGQRHRRLSLTLQRLHRAGARVTGFLWHQGEAESSLADMSAQDYKDGFLEMLATIRAQGFSAPVHVALSTFCGTRINRNTHNIRRALQELAAENRDILAGPDTDVIGADKRYDNCHFDGPGQDLAAGMWADALRSR